jgi:hypothetical protein
MREPDPLDSVVPSGRISFVGAVSPATSWLANFRAPSLGQDSNEADLRFLFEEG